MYENILLLDLNHDVSVTPQGHHIPEDIDSFLRCDTLQHGVHNNKGAGSSNTSAAMNNLEKKISRLKLLLNVAFHPSTTRKAL